MYYKWRLGARGHIKQSSTSSDSTQSIMDSLSLWTLFTNIVSDGEVQKITSLMLGWGLVWSYLEK